MAINSLSASSKGLSGLASGMDTESMVEKLLSGTKSKITKQQQKKTQLTYKQDMYRGISSKLRSLQSTYLSFSNTTNLRSSGFFNSMNAKSSSSAFKVTGTTQASAGTTKVDRIEQLAKAMSIKSSGAVSGGLSGVFNESAYNRFVDSMDGTLMVTVGEDVKEINIASLAGLNNQDAQTELNRLLGNENLKIQAEFKNGAFSFSSTDGSSFKLKGVDGGATLLGSTGEMSSANGALNVKMNTEALLPSIKVKLDGVEKTVYFNPKQGSNAVTADSVASALQKAITNAHGGGVSVTAQNGKIKFETSGTSRELVISGENKVLGIMGLTSGASNKINSAVVIDNLSFKEALIGDEFKFTINGVSFNVTADRTLNDVISEINSSKANVRVTYNSQEDKFSITSTVSGDGSNIEISQEQGNLLSSMFGAEGASSMMGKKLNGARANVPGGDAFSSMGGDFTLMIGGKSFNYTVKAKSSGEPYTAAELVSEMNTQLLNADANQYAAEAAKAAGVKFVYDVQKGEISMTAKAGQDVEIVSSKVMDELGFLGGESTIVTGNTTLGNLGMKDPVSITIGSRRMEFNANSKIDDLTYQMEAAVRAEYAAQGKTVPSDFKIEFEESNARFRIFGIDIPMEFKVSGDNGELFGSDKVEFNKASTLTADDITKGQNAKLVVNGSAIERNSNNFTLNGLQFELVTTTQQTDSNGDLLFKTDADGNPILDADGNKIALYEKPSTIDVTRDTEQIFEGIKKFVEAYNEVITEINKLTYEKATYKEYDPLTDEQKAELSDKEIELWEEKAKEGLLRGDSTLTNIASSLRSQLYQSVPGTNLRLSDIGITTMPHLSDKKESIGTLLLDNDTLRQMISQDPEGISKLFTASGTGFADRIDAVLTRATDASPTNPGSLVRIAGSGTGDTNNTIYKQIREINQNIETLKDRYDKEYSRYWKQFSSMEQMIQNMNQQSSWLASQFTA